MSRIANRLGNTPFRERPGRRSCSAADFQRVNKAALGVLPSLLARWLRDGRTQGVEFIALNPRRVDHRLGSFRINRRTGRWADFAIHGARGGDVVSLFAYLRDIGQVEAAQQLAHILGITSGGRHAS